MGYKKAGGQADRESDVDHRSDHPRRLGDGGHAPDDRDARPLSDDGRDFDQGPKKHKGLMKISKVEFTFARGMGLAYIFYQISLIS